VDGSEIEFSEGFTDLHTRVYEQILAGQGFGIPHARPSITLTHHIRTLPVTCSGDLAHPLLDGDCLPAPSTLLADDLARSTPLPLFQG